MRNPSPYHNRPSPISIPLENASVGKPFPTTAVQTTSPVSTKKGELGLICEENMSPLPHWKASRSLAVTQAIRRARRARLSGKPTLGRRARRPNSRNRFLTVFGWIRRLWLPTVFIAVSVAVRWRLQMGKTNCSVLALRHHARTSRSGSVCDPSSFPQTSDKMFYGGNMHAEMPSDLMLPLPLH